MKDCDACGHTYNVHYMTLDTEEAGCTAGTSLGDCNCSGYWSEDLEESES